MDDLWTDIVHENSQSENRTGYSTQKPEALLERIIKASSNDGTLIADFFCGSGTTGVVAERLGRRWIMADLSRYAIHVARKRLLDIEGCKFVVQNLGKYERQLWQGLTFKKHSEEQIPLYEYIEFLLKLYKAEPLTGMMWIHGKKGKRLVHVGSVDAPVTLSDIQAAMDECKKLNQTALDILGWEWELGLHDVVEKAAKEKGISLSLKYIPRDVMDPRAVESGEITFYELAYLEADVSKNKQGEVVIQLKDFVIPNHDMIPDEVRKQIKKWQDYIDYWAVDWDFNEDTFHNMWQSYRTRKDRTLELKTDPHVYEKKGKHKILIKVIDIFGNDTTRLEEVTA
jgi:adenine-specific DNA-methyltransferase